MTERVGLFGWPLGHSVSAPMHNAAFAALGLDGHYDLFPVPPERFESEVARLIAAGCRGFNVTIPHKQAAFRLPQVSEITLAAEDIGAVNTLVVKPDGTLKADNTDWRGFMRDLRAHDVKIEQQNCLVLGTGGSARAVVFGLSQMGAHSITLASRSATDHYEEWFKAAHGITSYSGIKQVLFDVVINCTPVGMYPRADESPWPDDTPVPANSVVYDLIYNPPVTRLMQQARDAGARAVGGLGMLVWQGAYAFEQWTGKFPPVKVMLDAAETALYSHTE